MEYCCLRLQIGSAHGRFVAAEVVASPHDAPGVDVVKLHVNEGLLTRSVPL